MRGVFILALSILLGPLTAGAEPPTLLFFYGKHQTFRTIGVPQRLRECTW